MSGRQVPQGPQQAVVGVGGSWGPAAAPVRGQGSESWLEEVMLFGLRPEDWVWGWWGSAHCLASAPAPAAPHLCRWRGGLRVQESCSLEAAPALGVDARHDGWAMKGAVARSSACLLWGGRAEQPSAVHLPRLWVGAGGRGCRPQPRTPSSSLCLLPRGKNWVSPGCGLGLHASWPGGVDGEELRAGCASLGLLRAALGGPAGPRVCGGGGVWQQQTPVLPTLACLPPRLVSVGGGEGSRKLRF